MTSVGVAEEDTCEVEVETVGQFGGDDFREGCTEAECPTCMDYTDDVFSSERITLATSIDGTRKAARTCGRGTQTRRCAALRDAEIVRIHEDGNYAYGHPPKHTDDQWSKDWKLQTADDLAGTYLHHSLKHRNKTLYVNAALAGRPCEPPNNLFRNPIAVPGDPVATQALHLPNHAQLNGGSLFPGESTEWIKGGSYKENAQEVVDTVCSDGGQGSHRVPLRTPTPNGLSLSQNWFYHWDFLCPYGSQPGVCPPRDLTVLQSVQDELDQPSGPTFGECHSEDVPDYECGSHLNPVGLAHTPQCPLCAGAAARRMRCASMGAAAWWARRAPSRFSRAPIPGL